LAKSVADNFWRQVVRSIRWLGDEDCHEHAAVGGKAASLSRFAPLHPVPPGFAIAALSAQMSSLPEDLQADIALAYDSLCVRREAANLAVAVRSSALDEDGAAASFAGQHDTYLNVRGASAVVDAVYRCVRSASNAEALAYRRERGIALEDVRVAVLVQELVSSDVSAVVFSANPLNGRRDEIMINANWGLGESVVGGTATPDTFIVDKPALSVGWRDIAYKERMTVLATDGTLDVEVPPDLRSLPSLDDEQVIQMAKLAILLEGAAGHAVDVECAFANGSLHLLQCRPITTLF
jgi:pyruvate,water dikinase